MSGDAGAGPGRLGVLPPPAPVEPGCSARKDGGSCPPGPACRRRCFIRQWAGTEAGGTAGEPGEKGRGSATASSSLRCAAPVSLQHLSRRDTGMETSAWLAQSRDRGGFPVTSSAAGVGTEVEQLLTLALPRG